MKSYIKYIILTIAIIMIIAGIYVGEIEVVINKATRICLECIGVG